MKNNFRKVALILGYTLLAGLFGSSQRSSYLNKAEEQGQQPNIILIIADDMAWDDCGACGHPNIQTPNIDRLADDGMMFHNAYLTTNEIPRDSKKVMFGDCKCIYLSPEEAL